MARKSYKHLYEHIFDRVKEIHILKRCTIQCFTWKFAIELI